MPEEKIEVIDLTNIILPPGLINKIPVELIGQYQFIPVALKENTLTVVFGEIPDEKVLNELKRALNYEIKFILASKKDIKQHLKRLVPGVTEIPSKSLFLRNVSESLQITRSQILKYKNLVKNLTSTQKKLNYVIIGSLTFIVVFSTTIFILFNFRNRGDNKIEPPKEKKIALLGKNAVVKTMEEMTKQKNAAKNARFIYEQNNKAVVLIYTYDSDGAPLLQGSGFIVRKDGAIVTNFHVIRGAHSIEIITNISPTEKDKIKLKVEGIIFVDKENDLAILKARGQDLPCVRLGDSNEVNPGEKVFIIGSPLQARLLAEEIDTMNTITEGLISNTRKNKIQISAQISPGSSGGPVFNAKGEVIGVATMLIRAELEAQNINFAMPTNLVSDKISETTFTPVSKFDLK
ncbi:MAG: trypsin-like peptidase domain-containing protein [Planctomycetota bacterium]